MARKTPSKNKLYVGDNLDVMHGMNSRTVELIYLDPPFNSKRMYRAPIGSSADKKAAKKGKTVGFHDIWVWEKDVDIRLLSFLEKHRNLFTYIDLVGAMHGQAMKTYLTFMAQRLIEMHRILKDTGSIYLHCDPTASHYLKQLMDEIFGHENFRNEIAWCYTGPSASKKTFPKKHDTIFIFSKTDEWTFNADAVRIPYKELHSDKGKNAAIWGRDGALQDEAVRKEYIARGKLPENYWTDISSGGHISPKERTGYPTQKPLALLDRIIKASSNPGDMVLDPFCGCATTCVSAHGLGRNWIGIDVERVAVGLVIDRLSEDEDAGQVQTKFKDFNAIETFPVRTDLEKMKWSEDAKGKAMVRQHFYGLQDGKCNGCKEKFDSRHLHIDHIYPESRGGAWHLDNLQLLCGNCNSIKGDRPMEYLLARIKERRSQMSLF